MNGGYILVDCTGIDLTGGDTPQTVDGIWDKAVVALEANKPIIAKGCVYGTGVLVSPVPVFGWYIDDDEIVIVGATLHIHIKDDDTLIVIDVTE